MSDKRWPAAKVTMRKVSELTPYANNSRTHSQQQIDQIAASIVEWGWTVPVLVDDRGVLIAGHGRLLAAHKLGIKEVPVMVADGWTEAQRKAYIIADNKLALNASWDSDLLRVELEALQELDFDVELTGFDMCDIDAVLDCPDVIYDDEATKSQSGSHAPNKSVSFWIYDHKVTDSRDETFEFIENNMGRIRALGDGRIVDAIIEALNEILG